MLRSSLAIIFIMVIISAGLLGLYIYNVRNYRLDKTLEKYTEELINITTEHKEYLYGTKNNVFKEVMSEPTEINKSYAYRAFYTFNAGEDIKSDLLILDDALTPIMSTNIIFEENYAFLNYLRIVINNLEENSHNPTLRVYRDTGNESNLLYVYPYKENEKVIGYSISIINGKEFKLIIEDPLSGFVIMDNYSNILATNNTHLKLSTGKLNKSFFNENGHSVKKSEVFENLSILTYISESTHWDVFITTLLVLLIATIIVFWYTYRFSKKISGRIGQSLYLFNYELNKVKTTSNHIIKIKTNDEFENLADEVNSMIQELRLSHKKYIELSKLNLKSERRRLEAQFHPHFLANTLETIRSAMYIDTDIANEVLLRMNSLLRYSIDHAEHDVGLSEEIHYLENYLSINSIRFDEFEYEILIDEKLNNLIVPKLFLLPLIENSLKYGFNHRRDLKVKIFVLNFIDRIVIRVIDNGNGLSKDKERQVNNFLKIKKDTLNHHGLLNTKNRIDLLYPKSCFRVVSKMNCTIVEITIKDGNYV